MNRISRPALWTAALSGVLLTVAVTSCSEDEPAPYVLQQTDVTITEPEGGFHLYVDELLRIDVQTVSDFGLTYAWTLNGESIPGGKRLEYMFSEIGEYELVLTVSQGNISYSYPVNVSVSLEQPDTPDEPETPGDSTPKTPYITKVFDFLPAVGQFTNTLPEYEEGDTQKTMNEKVLRSIGNNRKGMISLGGFGGYVVVGFDHTIENKAGLRDFRVLANAFRAPMHRSAAAANRVSSWSPTTRTTTDTPMTTNGTRLPEAPTRTSPGNRGTSLPETTRTT